MPFVVHLLAVLAGLFATATGSAAPETTGLALPATFRGDLPCADCVAIRHHLDLWPDGVFHLRRTWLGRPAPAGAAGDFFVDDSGRWQRDDVRRVLVLHGGAAMPLQFSITGPRRLRALDIHGQAIESSLPYALVSDGTLAPTPLALLLGGELRYLADAARFDECRTGRSYPVALAADWPRAEQAYRTAAAEPGARLYATFEGRIEPRPRMDGDGFEPTVVVTRFVNAWPGMRCERARAAAALTNTRWRIVRLGTATLNAAAGRHEPHLVLREDDGGLHYDATVGCNRIGGSYALGAGNALTFAAGRMTRMACPPPLDDDERALVRALEETARWRIEAATLELFGDDGTSLALFAAVYL